MKPLLVIANLKSNQILSEARKWLEEFSKFKSQITNYPNKKVIICPSFTLLQEFKQFIDETMLPVYLGAQDISHLPEGPYTGEVNGSQIKDFASYVIVGHSERRGFGEDENVIEEKLKMSKDYGLTSILCIQKESDNIPQEVSVIAYEPVFSIGTGNPDTPKDAESMAEKIKGENKAAHVLYGGSVNPENVKGFTEMENIDGVLVGHESLNPLDFFRIVENA